MLLESELKDIINGCIANNRLAQEKLYNAFFHKMLSVVHNYIKCPHKSEEVLNNGFLKVFKKIEQYNYTGSFEGWIRKIMYHSACDYLRLNENKNVIYTELIENTSIQAHNNLNFNQLLRVIDCLPKTTKKVFDLATFHGYSHAQIGYMLKMSPNTSKWHLSEGKSLLRSKIMEMELNT